MRRLLGAALIFVLLASITVGSASAQGCAPGTVQQRDMVGLYVSPSSLMRLELFPCGGAYLQWDNEYGRHAAAYSAVGAIGGGGYAADGYLPDPMVGYLDSCHRIGWKPAEPGYIQLVTIGDYMEQYRVYRLQKV